MMSGLLVFTGLGQLALALASLVLPHLLRWKEETARLQPLTARVFWVYAGYILGTNLCLGGLTAFAPQLLLDRSPLARAVAGYGAVYWGVRLIIQVVWFRGLAPEGRWYAIADLALMLAFALWSVCYGAVLFDLW